MDLQSFYPYQLVVLAEAVSQAMAQVYAVRFDLSRDEWRLVAGLAELGPTRTTELMAYSTLQKMPASRAAASLEQRGLIERSLAADDRRNHVLKLTPAVQRRVAAGVLSAGHARALVTIDNSEIQDRLATRVVAEGLSVRALEEIVAVGPKATKEQRKAKPTLSAPKLADLAERLSERYDTRVKVDLGRSKGRITVEFATLEDLERIVDMMDPKQA